MSRASRQPVADSPNPPWRPAAKRGEVIGELRQDLVSGRYSPGTRMPTRVELINRFDVSAMTVQHAVDHLKRDGFVVARGRLGTFVADYPPHLHHYGLVFAGDPVGPEEDRRFPFQVALLKHARRPDATDRRSRIRVYRHLGSGSRSADYSRLVADAQSQRLAGLIVADFWRVRNWIKDLPVPIVTFTSEPQRADDGRPLFHAIDLDMTAFRNRALDCLRERNITRAGFILGRVGEDYFGELQEAAAARGIEVRPEWVQGADVDAPYWARHVMHAMFRRPPAERPQALVITDDIFLESATAGLLEAGVRVPEELTVISHTNFPTEKPAGIPLVRLGFSAQSALTSAMGTIDSIRRGRALPGVTRVFPVFEDELAACGASIVVH